MPRRRTLVVLILLAVVVASLALAGVFGWAEYQRFQAREAMQRQDFARAFEHFTQALQIWPRSAPLHLQAAQAARRAGMLRQADEHLTTSQRLQGGLTDAMRLERLLHRAADGEVAAVQEVLWRSLDENPPEKTLILEALVQGYLNVSLSSGCRAAVTQLLELQPDNVIGLYARGVLQERSEDDEPAIADFRHVLEIVPDHFEARKHLADLLIRINPTEALQHFNQLLIRRPGDAAVLLSQANCYKALGDPARAAQVLDALLAERPNDSAALMERGWLAVQDGQAAGGEKWLRQAIRVQPTNEDAHYHLYECLLQQPGRAADAQAQFAEWKRVKADLLRLHEIRATRLDQAMRDPALLHEIGLILLRSKQDDNALRLFRHALELNPQFEPVHRTLAEYYRAKGKDDLAAQHDKRTRSGAN